MKLKVTHDTAEYRIYINIEYSCVECNDHRLVTEGRFDDIREVPCPYCCYWEE